MHPLKVLSFNIDGGGRPNYTVVCDAIEEYLPDCTVIVDARCPEDGGSLVTMIVAQLGPGYSVHVHSNASRQVGGVMFVSGPRLSHKRLLPACPLASTAALTCRLGGSEVLIVGSYWPFFNPNGDSSL